MSYLPAVTLASPVGFAVAALVACAAIAAATVRRVSMPRASLACAGIGAMLLAVSAGGLTWQRSPRGRLAVVVDVSPSTRVAGFRQRDELLRRIEQFVGDTDFSLYTMSAGLRAASIERFRGTDQPTTRTAYEPPRDADAVLLFTDAQFELPPAADSPPTYVVIDPALDHADDAAVERLEARGDDGFAATVRLDGSPRELILGNTGQERPLPPGRSVVTWKSDATAVVTGVRLVPRDSWRENDEMIITPRPPVTPQRWWVSESAPPPAAGWRAMKPAELPSDGAPYLAAGVIVLDNVPADAIDRAQRDRLEQYARDLGGGLVLLGGDHAFAAGGYAGTPLESVSPLTSNPPEPTTHWVILADSSGSMAAAIGDNTRWAFATNAIAQLLPLLPADDLLTAGDFARARRWWCRDLRVSEAMQRRIFPRDVHPTGPTNLGPALRDVAQSADGGARYAIIIVTDAQAQIDSAASLAEELAKKRVTVHVLSTSPVPPQNDVRAVVERTGGALLDESDPRQWPARLRQLARGAAAPWLMREPVEIEFARDVPQLAPARAEVWNRAWLKSGATALAVARAANEPAGATADQRPPMIAGWNLGAGACVATTFQPPPALVTLLADRVMVPPRDPRFSVTWDDGWPMRVVIDAVDAGRFMNDLGPTLELSADVVRPERGTPIPQVAPGRYALAIDSFPRGGIASVFLGTTLLDRTVLPGRYPQEFARIGNDRDAMQRLAESTGGRVIEPTDVRPIEFRWPPRDLPLGAYLAASGGAAVALGLIRWRLG